MLRDVRVKLWQSVLIAFVIVTVLFTIGFTLLPSGQESLLVQATP